MEIKIHRYQLPWPENTSRHHRSEGALIAVRKDSELWGYADLHPWPTLGDIPLDQQIQLLLNGKPTPQTQVTLSAAQADLTARLNQHKIPSFSHPVYNHHLILDEVINFNLLATYLNVYDSGTLTPPFKWKLSPSSITGSLNFLNECAMKFPTVCWRLDFNSLFSTSEVIQFWEKLSIEARSQIEFIEDPCSYSQRDWELLESHKIPLAIDGEIKTWTQDFTKFSFPLTSSGQTILVLKPAIQFMEFWQTWLRENPHSFLITSYLDHPVGLIHALRWAELFQNLFPHLMRISGLNLSLSPQKLSQFWPSMQQNPQKGNIWSCNSSSDLGIGFTEHLETLPWQFLKPL